MSFICKWENCQFQEKKKHFYKNQWHQNYQNEHDFINHVLDHITAESSFGQSKNRVYFCEWDGCQDDVFITRLSLADHVKTCHLKSVLGEDKTKRKKQHAAKPKPRPGQREYEMSNSGDSEWPRQQNRSDEEASHTSGDSTSDIEKSKSLSALTETAQSKMKLQQPNTRKRPSNEGKAFCASARDIMQSKRQKLSSENSSNQAGLKTTQAQFDPSSFNPAPCPQNMAKEIDTIVIPDSPPKLPKKVEKSQIVATKPQMLEINRTSSPTYLDELDPDVIYDLVPRVELRYLRNIELQLRIHGAAKIKMLLEKLDNSSYTNCTVCKK